MHDLHNNIQQVRVIPPVAAGTTGTGQSGAVVDRRGYGGVEFICDFGAITATAATFTVTILEGDATGSLTSVADADLLGTEALAGIAAGTPRANNVNENVSKRVGYRGSKRYVSATVVNTATAATPIAVTAILHSPNVGPVDNP